MQAEDIEHSWTISPACESGNWIQGSFCRIVPCLHIDKCLRLITWIRFGGNRSISWMECSLRCKCTKASPTSSWRKLLIAQHLAHPRSASILFPATCCGKNVQFFPEASLQSRLCAWSLWETTEITSRRKMRQSLLLLCTIQRTHFHGRERCRMQDFEARLCFRTQLT